MALDKVMPLLSKNNNFLAKKSEPMGFTAMYCSNCSLEGEKTCDFETIFEYFEIFVV